MGLTYRTVDIQDATGTGICLDILKGYWEPASVRGERRITPAMVGEPVSLYVRDRRIILLEGVVLGIGSDVTGRRQSLRDLNDDLMALCQYDDDPGPLVASGPYLGLGTGETATIQARCTSAIGTPANAQLTAYLWSIELESVDPEWVIAS